MNRLQKYRIVLTVVFIFVIILTGIVYVHSINKKIPDSLKVYAGDQSRFDFSMPVEGTFDTYSEALNIDNAYKDYEGNMHISMGKPFTVSSSSLGKYSLNLKLFGLFDLKKISINVIDGASVIPCGNVIGIKIETKGLLILGTGSVTGKDGIEYEPAKQIVRTGDYITKINGQKVKSINDFIKKLNNCQTKKVKLRIRRDSKEKTVSVDIINCKDGTKKIGVWVREDTQGIGTLTFVDKDGKFNALGHGITDADTGVLLDLQSGDLYDTEVIKVIKGKSGEPGEIMGMILESKSGHVGGITVNSSLGISGNVDEAFLKKIKKSGAAPMPVALRQDIKKGPALIRCQIGNEIKEYKVQITDINRGSKDNKGLVIKVTDEELLKEAGGIVQGMSGSPIIQDNKIVGAVTHVFVNDPTKGYGIFAETMLTQN